ncbi:MAG: 4-(cytidine 5'-diphospho)-2-C-methyl-D-erythritol kinase [Prolixibacteraceae bacterium]|nr:4-(cytidine 5'-diphospho)-2-C-methyl-D-erythritol kinase [Prolixibacteraceae bacterium]
MVLFSNAKINIGLEVIRKRSDGFHDLETVFYPLTLCDIMEIVPSREFRLSTSGLSVDATGNENLITKAYLLLKEQYKISPVRIHLHKMIPMGAGLGGGSSNAAYTLTGLNALFDLGLSNNELTEMAVTLGSDCAFFIGNKPVFAEGRGNLFTNINLNLKSSKIVVVKPACSVSTAEAYRNIKPQAPAVSLPDIIKYPPAKWSGKVLNRFEENVFQRYPEIEGIKNQLYALGAMYASMSGSGSAVFGIFKKDAPSFKKEFSGLFYWEE